MRTAVLVVATIIFFVVEAICINNMEENGVWYDLKNSLIVSIREISPLIIGILAGIITSIILYVVL